MGRLFWKIFLALWLTLMLTGLGVGLVVHWYGQKRLAQMTDLVAGPRAELSLIAVATTLQHEGIEATTSLLQQWRDRRGSPGRGRRVLPVLVVDESGRDLLDRPVPAAVLAQVRVQLETATRVRGMRRVVGLDDRSYVLFIPASVDGRLGGHRHFAPVGPPFVFQLLLVTLASLLFSAGLAWYLSRPLRHLRAASQDLAHGALDTRVMPYIGTRRDEIADLGRDFDYMAERLQNLVDAQQRLLHDVSHELRSPLARLQVAVGLARQQPDKLQPTLERIENETERLDTLVGEVLTLSRLEAGVSGANEERFDIVALLGEVVADAQFEAEAKECKVLLTADESLIINGREELMRRALENVIRNAVNYTVAGTRVDVSLHANAADTSVMIAVCDHGPGVPEAELASLFDPFFRASGEGNRGGYGLGLAIARRAIEAHDGSIRAYNGEEGGLCVEISLVAEKHQSSDRTQTDN